MGALYRVGPIPMYARPAHSSLFGRSITIGQHAGYSGGAFLALSKVQTVIRNVCNVYLGFGRHNLVGC